MNKTFKGFDWERGYFITRTLTRSFDTLEAAQKFAEGKKVMDIFRKNGRFTVEWLKEKDNNG